MSAHPLHGREGLTLIELVIALAVLGIVGAIVIPNYYANKPTRHLKADAMDIATNMRYAKLNAVRRNMNVGLYFYTSKESYCIFGDSNGNGQFDAADGLLKPVKDMRSGVSFDRGHADWSITNNRVLFSPDGSAVLASGTVVIENTKDQTRKITVQSTTGRILVQ